MCNRIRIKTVLIREQEDVNPGIGGETVKEMKAKLKK